MELQLDRVTKQYGTKLAVDRMNLSMKAGVYGLLGANGAGKTTLMRLLCDILNPTSGEIRYDGQNIHVMGEEYRSLLGYLPQNFGYYPEFTAEKFMLYMAALKGLNRSFAQNRTEELLRLVGLEKERRKKIKTFSGGMKRRLGIAQAMLNEPEILILDEPTAGLDPKERVRFRNLISSFSKDEAIKRLYDSLHARATTSPHSSSDFTNKRSNNSIASSLSGCTFNEINPSRSARINAKNRCEAVLYKGSEKSK